MEPDLIERYHTLVQRQAEMQEEKTQIDHELARLAYIKYKVKVDDDNKLVDNVIDCLKRDGIYIAKHDTFDQLEQPALSRFKQLCIKKYKFDMGVSESGVTLEDMPLPSNETQAKIFSLVIEKLTPHLPILTEVFLQPVQPDRTLIRKYGVRLKTTLPIDFDLEEGASTIVWFVDDKRYVFN
jgi:hypothetical protein